MSATEEGDLTCICGHNKDTHWSTNDDHFCFYGYPADCCCPRFESVNVAAERQGMARAAEAGYGI